jgi:hypothetical protein
MKYTIHITSRPSERFTNIFALTVAKEHGISIQDAVQVINSTPFVFLTNIVREEMLRKTKLLEEMGINFTIDESGGEEIKYRPEIDDRPKCRTAPKNESLPENHPNHSNRKNGKSILQFIIKMIIIAGSIVVLAAFLKAFNIPLVFNSTFPGLFNFPSYQQLQEGSDSNLRRNISPRDIQKAQALAESAVCANQKQALTLYLQALALDPKNFLAWNGLLKLYLQLDPSAAGNIEVRINHLFGEEALQIGKAVDSLGILSSMTIADDVCRLEYLPHSREKQQLLHNAFLITRSCQRCCACRAVSLYARTKKGCGLLTLYTGHATAVTWPDFIHESTISFNE